MLSKAHLGGYGVPAIVCAVGPCILVIDDLFSRFAQAMARTRYPQILNLFHFIKKNFIFSVAFSQQGCHCCIKT